MATYKEYHKNIYFKTVYMKTMIKNRYQLLLRVNQAEDLLE